MVAATNVDVSTATYAKGMASLSSMGLAAAEHQIHAADPHSAFPNADPLADDADPLRPPLPLGAAADPMDFPTLRRPTDYFEPRVFYARWAVQQMLAHTNGVTWTPLYQISFTSFNTLGALPANRPWKTTNKAVIWNELTASPFFVRSETAGRGGTRSKRTDVVQGTFRPVLRRLCDIEALYPTSSIPEHQPCDEVFDIQALLRYMHGDPARRHNAFIVLDYYESLLALG